MFYKTELALQPPAAQSSNFELLFFFHPFPVFHDR